MERAEERICHLERALDAANERAKAAETTASEAHAALKTVQEAIRAKFLQGRAETPAQAA
jgi:hypothetical protein